MLAPVTVYGGFSDDRVILSSELEANPLRDTEVESVDLEIGMDVHLSNLIRP